MEIPTKIKNMITPQMSESYNSAELAIITEPKTDAEVEDIEEVVIVEQNENIKPKKMSEDCLKQILKGIEQGLPVKEYAKPEYSAEQMAEIRVAMAKKLEYSVLLQPKVSAAKMREWRKALENGANAVDVEGFITRFTTSQAKEIRKGIADKQDVSVFADPHYSSAQMREIRLAQKAKVDVALLTSAPFTSEQMRKLRQRMVVLKLIEVIKIRFSELWQKFISRIEKLIQTEMPNATAETMNDIKNGLLQNTMEELYQLSIDEYPDFEELSFDEQVDEIAKEINDYDVKMMYNRIMANMQRPLNRQMYGTDINDMEL